MKRNKDTAASWLVVASVTLAHFIEQGLIKSLSVLLPDIREQFTTYTWVIGWSISFVSGWGCVLGLASNILVSKSLGRPSLIVCGITATIGLLICSSASNPLTLLFGLIFFGFIMLEPIITLGAVPQYFDAHFDTAVVICSCGTGLGITVMPILTQMLRDVYGWRGTLVLLSGLCAHSILCGALIKIDAHNEQEVTDDEIWPILSTSARDKPPATTGGYKLISSFTKTLSDLIDSSLLTDIHFVTLILIPSFVIGYTFTGWLIYTVSYAVSNGASIREASIVATSGGVGLTAIRIILPILHKLLTYKQLIYLGSFLSAMSLILMTQFGNFEWMVAMSVCYGISYGILGAEMYIAIKKVTEESKYFSGVAWYSLFEGAGSITSGFITGWLFDMTGSFTASFAILGVISLITVVSFGLEEIWIGIKRKNASI
ncbi:monocarboxylate transporter 11-like [Amphiura filiformis]|uniref:monocarboxylate transporter 11-like n=1 Tax=Amphiura filiformis TaxID=82378 RepID=UPI003B21DE53